MRVTSEEKRRLRKVWTKAFIIKLTRHALGYNFLVRRLRIMCQIKSAMKAIDVGNDVYILQFADDEERDRALYKGPWVVKDHYLAVRQWCHIFYPFKFNVYHLAVLVHFLNLSIEYFEQKFTMKIGKLIGTTLKVDETTMDAAREKFARLCVEVDFTKPLCFKYLLRKEILNIEYESIHTICFKCGKYEHHQEACTLNADKSK